MFSRYLKIVAGAALAVGSASALAQTVEVGDVVVAGGAVATVDVTYTAPVPSNIVLIQLDVNFDQSQLGPPDLSACNGVAPNGGSTFCSNPSPGVVRILNDDAFLNPLASGVIGTISWNTATVPANVGTYPLTVSGLLFSDNLGSPVLGGAIDGSVTVQAPAGSGFYASVPAPGGNLDLGTAVVGSPATSITDLTIQNLSPDTTFDVTAINTAGPVVFAPPPTFTVGFGSSQVVSATCTPTARGDNGGTFSVVHDSAAGAPSPVDYTFDCVGLSPNVQVPAGPVNLAALTVDPAPTANINVTNPQDGFTSAASNVTATAGVGNTEITVTTGGPTTINPDASFNFVVSCDNTAAGSFSRTIDITWDNPLAGGPTSDSIVVNCEITDAIPSFDSTPVAPGPLAFGIVTNGTTSAPIGINVGNDGVGPAPDSDLTITSVVSSDPQFLVNVISTGPFPVGAPSGGNDIEISCAPTSVGAIAGTITVNHNGDDNPTQFNATCEGESDALFSSVPAPGGVLNLGVVPPSITTPEGFIDFSNGGAVDSLQVDCSVSDPDGVFTFTPNPISFSIAAGATESVGFQCTPPTPDSFAAAVSCTIGGAAGPIQADYTVVCQGEPLVVPTMNRWGLVIMSLMLLQVAGVAGRRMMA